MKCIKCGETRESEFSPSHIKKHDYRCKLCTRKYEIARYAKNPESFRVYHSKYYQTHKSFLAKKNTEYSRIRRLTHPEIKLREEKLARQRNEAYRIKVISYYSQGKMVCTECGFTDMRALCLDHIDNDGTIQKRNGLPSGGRGLIKYLIDNNYPQGYQVLCANCNLIKEYKRRQSEGRNHLKGGK